MELKFKEIRKISGLSQTKFSLKYNIPLPTIKAWEIEKYTPPGYVLELLYSQVKADLLK